MFGFLHSLVLGEQNDKFHGQMIDLAMCAYTILPAMGVSCLHNLYPLHCTVLYTCTKV